MSSRHAGAYSSCVTWPHKSLLFNNLCWQVLRLRTRTNLSVNLFVRFDCRRRTHLVQVTLRWALDGPTKRWTSDDRSTRSGASTTESSTSRRAHWTSTLTSVSSPSTLKLIDAAVFLRGPSERSFLRRVYSQSRAHIQR